MTRDARPMVPIEEQIIEVEREIRQRARLYPDWVTKGRLKQDTADRKLASLRAAQSTLTWLHQNMDWIRPLAQRRLEEKRLREEVERHPVTQAVLEAFPGAEIADVRQLEPDGESIRTA